MSINVTSDISPRWRGLGFFKVKKSKEKDDRTMKPLKSYIICSVQRSGTHLLSSILEKTGLAGSPDEYFISGGDQTWEERWRSASRAAYIERVFRRTTTPNGVWGFVVMWVYFDRMLQMLREISPDKITSGSQLLATIFNQPKYIWMRRRDRVQQAVSWAIASQTDVWVDKPGKRRQPRSEPRFDFDLIDDQHDKIMAGEAGWEDYFREHQITPLVLFYEDIIGFSHETAVRVLNFLEVPFSSPLETVEPTTQKQANSISQEWAASYRKLKQDRMSRLARALGRIRADG